MVYLDGIHFKVRDSGRIINKCCYTVLAINVEGLKEVLGLWISDTEGSKFWMTVLTDLKNRGVEDVLLACTDGLKGIYRAPSEEAGLKALEEMKEKWPQYKIHLIRWEQDWPDLSVFFLFSPEIRRLIYTTNPVESLHRQMRKVTKTTSIFPHDEALKKLLFLTQQDISCKWTMPVQNWGLTISQLAIEFPDRIKL